MLKRLPIHLNALDISLNRMDTDLNKIGWFWAVISQIYYRFLKKEGSQSCEQEPIMETNCNVLV